MHSDNFLYIPCDLSELKRRQQKRAREAANAAKSLKNEQNTVAKPAAKANVASEDDLSPNVRTYAFYSMYAPI